MDRRNFSRIGEKMSKVYLCKGAYAETPFFIEKQRVNLYSIEEVCYYIKENICLLDKSIMTPAFIRFIGEECELEKVEKELKTILHRKKSLADFCECILREEGKTAVEEISSLIESISKSESLDVFEKRKSNADYFVRKKIYFRAMIEYRKLLEKANPKEKVLKSEIFHNMGVIYANLFHFSDAKDYFLKAYEMGEREESLLCYLAACKLGSENAEYAKVLNEKFIYKEHELELENLLNEIKAEWDISGISGTLHNPVYDVEITNRNDRIKKMEQIVSEWKEEYRVYIEE
jgi:hypothetical protein